MNEFGMNDFGMNEFGINNNILNDRNVDFLLWVCYYY
jgi:hypothetical protein